MALEVYDEMNSISSQVECCVSDLSVMQLPFPFSVCAIANQYIYMYMHTYCKLVLSPLFYSDATTF